MTNLIVREYYYSHLNFDISFDPAFERSLLLFSDPPYFVPHLVHKKYYIYSEQWYTLIYYTLFLLPEALIQIIYDYYNCFVLTLSGNISIPVTIGVSVISTKQIVLSQYFSNITVTSHRFAHSFVGLYITVPFESEQSVDDRSDVISLYGMSQFFFADILKTLRDFINSDIKHSIFPNYDDIPIITHYTSFEQNILLFSWCFHKFNSLKILSSFKKIFMDRIYQLRPNTHYIIFFDFTERVYSRLPHLAIISKKDVQTYLLPEFTILHSLLPKIQTAFSN